MKDNPPSAVWLWVRPSVCPRIHTKLNFAGQDSLTETLPDNRCNVSTQTHMYVLIAACALDHESDMGLQFNIDWYYRFSPDFPTYGGNHGIIMVAVQASSTGKQHRSSKSTSVLLIFAAHGPPDLTLSKLVEPWSAFICLNTLYISTNRNSVPWRFISLYWCRWSNISTIDID